MTMDGKKNYGNLYVEYKVVLPENIDEKFRRSA